MTQNGSWSLERPTTWLEGWYFESAWPLGGKIEFNHVDHDLINHAYEIKTWHWSSMELLCYWTHRCAEKVMHPDPIKNKEAVFEIPPTQTSPVSLFIQVVLIYNLHNKTVRLKVLWVLGNWGDYGNPNLCSQLVKSAGDLGTLLVDPLKLGHVI